MSAPAVRRRGAGRRVASISAGFCVAAIGLLTWLGLHLLREVAPPSPPHHPHNVSWQYGAKLMQTTLYGTLSTSDVETECRAALLHPRNPPRHFDVDEAVYGCRYTEWAYDN